MYKSVAHAVQTKLNKQTEARVATIIVEII